MPNEGWESKIPEAVKEAGAARLRSRVERLAKLVELDAPPLVIAAEVLGIQQAIWLMDPEAISGAMAIFSHTRVKSEAGFCQSHDCANRVSRGEITCPSCTKKLEDMGDDEVEEIIAEEDKNGEPK